MEFLTKRIFLISLCLFALNTLLFAQEEEKLKQDTLTDSQKNKREFRFIQQAEMGRDDSVLFLLDQGTDINARTWDNYTALIFASQNGHLQTVRILLLNGAKPDLRSDSKKSALVSAARFGHTSIIEQLLVNGANINIRDVNNATALMYSSAFDDFNTTELLLFYEADTDLRGKNGETALFTATADANYSIAKLLLEYEANPDIPDNDKNTPSHIATGNADLEILGLLIESGADINKINNRGYSPLDAAIMNDDSLMVSILLENGADPLHKVSRNINTMTLAEQHTRGKDIINILSAHNVKRLRSPYIEYYSVSLTNSWNFTDYMSGIEFGFHEARYNFGIQTGYCLNPWEKTILLDRGNSVYYQVRERRHMIFAGIEKYIRLHKSINMKETGISIGVKEYYSFGNYQGLKEDPEEMFLFSPSVGIYYRWSNADLFIKYEYLEMNKNKISPHRINVGASFFIRKK